MGLTLRSLNVNRTMWLFDTFEGLPPPSNADPDRDFANYYTGMFRGGDDEVAALLSDLDIREGTHLVKGLFQDTLPVTEGLSDFLCK